MEKPNIPLKTSIEVLRIKRPARLIGQILHDLRSEICPGKSTEELNEMVERYVRNKKRIRPQNEEKGFPSVICASINNVAAHGIPNKRKLIQGDIITVDISLSFDGWFADAAWTYPVGKIGPDAKRLLKAAKAATQSGIKAAKAGKRMGDVGAAISATAASWGCKVLKQFGGHGIGTALHEEPFVPNQGERGTGQPIVPGMVFTIEPILTLGDDASELLTDGWTYITEDGALSAQFEHTIAIFSDRTEVLTVVSKEPYSSS